MEAMAMLNQQIVYFDHDWLIIHGYVQDTFDPVSWWFLWCVVSSKIQDISAGS